VRCSLIVVLFISGLNCGRQSRESSTAPRDPWTILSADEADRFRRLCSRPFPKALSGTWQPSTSDVMRAEARLDATLDRAFSRLPSDRGHRPPRYLRQYGGFWRGGRRVLYVHGFAAGHETNWRSKAAVGLCDGGTMSFGGVYNLDDDSFDSFCFDVMESGRLPGDCG
jgi:hypothetical protein